MQAARQLAATGQERLRPLLSALEQSGDVAWWTGLAIVDRVIVRGTPAAIDALSRAPDVAWLGEELESDGALETGTPGSPTDPSWPLKAMGVPAARRAHLDGSGVTIGLIDSGVSAAHERLAASYRGGPRSWFDPLHGTPAPSDVQLGHGSAVLGCAAGVAPHAKWVAAVGLNNGRANNLLLWQAADWMFTVAQPDVLIAPWRVPGERCDRSLQPMIDAFEAAQILIVFAAGNDGPAPGTDVPPANVAGALSVGAVDRELRIDSSSSRGPNSCAPAVFPEVVAPGAGVAVALPAGATLYREATGTSFAAGYAAGVAALLLQRCPRTAVARVRAALVRSAVDLGPPGPDPAYGHGLVHAGRALHALAGCR